jgi:indolepyruvate ferredoxin oxidoreductase beta subunit
MTRKGRVVKTTSLGGFLLLYALSRLKPIRRRSLRFATEQAALTQWLDLVAETARADYALALQVARMRSMVKGYGDTHARGQAKFDTLVALLPRLRGRGNGAVLLEGLIKAALADENGQALDKAIADLAPAPGISSAAGASRPAS